MGCAHAMMITQPPWHTVRQPLRRFGCSASDPRRWTGFQVLRGRRMAEGWDGRAAAAFAELGLSIALPLCSSLVAQR
eukprot:624208-Hanusia_phi.AAC.2